MRGRLLQFELRLQALVEGSAARFLPGVYAGDGVARRLAEAMRAGIRMGEQGDFVAPDVFTLWVDAQRAEALQAENGLLDELGRVLEQAGLEEGFQFMRRPVVRVAVSGDVEAGEMRVSAQHSGERDCCDDVVDTAGVETAGVGAAEQGPKNAYLIVDGTLVFPLSGGAVNIGRRADNQLVIDDRRISRLHAQLRVVKGCYVVFDLDSLGGTWVNGVRVQQHTLLAGDVISLAGLPLVYGQDVHAPDETQEYTAQKHTAMDA